MSGYKPYPKYKDSGVEWLGKVPEHWSTSPLKRLATICNGRDYKEIESENGKYPVIGSGGEFARASEFIYNGESVLLGRKGTIDKPLYINGPFWTVDTMFYTFLNSNVSGRFLFYCSLTIHFGRYSTNTAVPSMTQESLGQIKFATPSYVEQKSIATFLDRETSKLDILIREQKELITLLQEKRQALISNAVTKGLNPKVKMKDSGVEWLGEVPEHWEVKKLGRLCSRIGSGKTPSGGAEIYSDTGVIFLRSQNIHDEGMELSDVAFIDFAIDEEMAWSRVKAGDILINITGASIGRTCLVPDGFSHANVNQHVCTIRLIEQSARKFISIQLKSYYFKRLIEAIQDGGNRDSLNFDQISSFRVLIAPLSEMNAICDFLDRALGNLNSLVKEAEETIDLMHEHRASLISEAVTGKIDVRKQA